MLPLLQPLPAALSLCQHHRMKFPILAVTFWKLSTLPNYSYTCSLFIYSAPTSFAACSFQCTSMALFSLPIILKLSVRAMFGAGGSHWQSAGGPAWHPLSVPWCNAFQTYLQKKSAFIYLFFWTSPLSWLLIVVHLVQLTGTPDYSFLILYYLLFDQLGQ